MAASVRNSNVLAVVLSPGLYARFATTRKTKLVNKKKWHGHPARDPGQDARATKIGDGTGT